MPILQLPLHSYQLRSRPASPARLVNCFPEQLPAGGRSPVMLTRSPGVKAWITVGTGPIEAMYTAYINFASGAKEYLYVVSGSELYYVDSAGTATLIGDIGAAVNIDIDSNTTSLVVVNEPHAYTWDGATFAQIIDDDYVSRGAGDVEFLDDFLLFREPDSGRFFGADFGSATSFDSLQFAIADSAPDNLNGMIADHRQLIAFGTKTTEIWENTGAAGFPFERNINGTIEVGCHNSKTVARTYNQIFWVADDLTVRRLDGIAPTKMSTTAIEQHLADETVLDAFPIEMEGHFFYNLTTSGGTYSLDVVTGEWSERESYGFPNWNPRHHVQFSGMELVGDSNTNKIGELDAQTYEDWGSTQRMEWTYAPVFAEGQRAFHKRFEVIMETGVGATVGQGADPKIMLQKSDDGGKTWQSLPDKTFGKLGKRLDRAVWHNLGSSRQRVYRCAVSDPVAVTITDTIIEVEGGRL